MSFISDFEDRIGSVFGSAPQGYAEPFSFKKLAKRAAKEMEHETYEIDGIDTAPALYTILVSPTDDSLMRPLYADLTAEVAAFVAAQAERRNYIFVGTPLVRFMVDPSLKSGKFAVFAAMKSAPFSAAIQASAEQQPFFPIKIGRPMVLLAKPEHLCNTSRRRPSPLYRMSLYIRRHLPIRPPDLPARMPVLR